MKRKEDYEAIIEASFRLIQAMLYETDTMPRAYQAPNTVNAAGSAFAVTVIAIDF